MPPRDRDPPPFIPVGKPRTGPQACGFVVSPAPPADPPPAPPPPAAGRFDLLDVGEGGAAPPDAPVDGGRFALLEVD